MNCIGDQQKWVSKLQDITVSNLTSQPFPKKDKSEADFQKDETAMATVTQLQWIPMGVVCVTLEVFLYPFVSRAAPQRAQSRRSLGRSCVVVGKSLEARSPRIGPKWSVGGG